jgi:hypothetical protein
LTHSGNISNERADNADRLAHRQEPSIRNYCFDPVQLPTHPSDRRNVPEPLRPEKRPDMLQVRLPAAPIPDAEPFGLTVAVPYWPTILLPVMTTVSEEVPQGEPTLVRTHAPSKLPPPPHLCGVWRRGTSASGVLRRAGFGVLTARDVSREPDSDFSSLLTLPPALPDCALARPGKATTASAVDSREAFPRRRIMFCINMAFPMDRVLAAPSALHRAGPQDLPVSPHPSIAATSLSGSCARLTTWIFNERHREEPLPSLARNGPTALAGQGPFIEAKGKCDAQLLKELLTRSGTYGPTIVPDPVGNGPGRGRPTGALGEKGYIRPFPVAVRTRTGLIDVRSRLYPDISADRNNGRAPKRACSRARLNRLTNTDGDARRSRHSASVT